MDDYELSERFIVETDLDEFVRYCRVFSFCNFALSLDPNVSKEEKEEIIVDKVEESMDLMYSTELDSMISLEVVKQIVDMFLKYDQIDNLYYFDTPMVLMDVIQRITMHMVIDGCNQLVDEGKLIMSLDEDGEIMYNKVED